MVDVDVQGVSQSLSKGSDSSKLLTLRCMSLRIFTSRNTPARWAYVQKAAVWCHRLWWRAFGCDVKGFIWNDDPAACVSVCAWWYDRRLCWQSASGRQQLEEFVLTRANVTLSVRRTGFAATLSFYIMTDVRFETGFLQNNRHLLPTFSPALHYKSVPLFDRGRCLKWRPSTVAVHEPKLFKTSYRGPCNC